jgi:HicB family
MDLSPYVDALRADLDAAAAAGGDDVQATARLLSAALDASLRLCLVDALSSAAAEVTAASDLEVEIRMHGREPQLVVASRPTPVPPRAEPAEDDGDDRGVVRLTVRLPESLKARAEQQAARDGVSVNAWIVRAIGAAAQPAGSARGPQRTTGFARG